MASSCISFTAIKFNLKTITDNRNSPEYYLKLNTQSIHEKKKKKHPTCQNLMKIVNYANLPNM